MDTVPQPQGDQMPLGSRASIPSDDRLTTHATETEISAGMNQSDSRTRAAPAPQPGAPLPSPAEVSATRERSQWLASVSRNPESFGSTGADAEPDSADLCAAVLLACLFCQPLDCLLATLQGCNSWMWSLCASACGCKCSTLRPPLHAWTHSCGPCEPVGAHCCLCDLCRQTTECLDFAMEVSQMLYH